MVQGQISERELIDTYSEAETAEREQATLSRMLRTPHKPHKPLKESSPEAKPAFINDRQLSGIALPVRA